MRWSCLTAPNGLRAGVLRTLVFGCLLLLVMPLVACDSGREPASPPTGKPFTASLQGKLIHLVVDDCEVFLIDAEGKRERVVTTDFYPMFTACQRENISSDEQYITVSLGRMAFGAGGCCATHGTWRTRDGQYWERHARGKWLSPGEFEALQEKERAEQNKRVREERSKRAPKPD